MSNKNKQILPPNEIIFYETEDGKISIAVRFENENIWLTQKHMAELFDFINTPNSPKYDLLKAAIAHHRFVWIHPFGNGNGRGRPGRASAAAGAGGVIMPV